ncbi:MAG: S1-like domain-containing RNA-binding protein [Motiliproteus sp.]
MTKLGMINRLKVIKERDFGVYLDGEQLGEILLPKSVVPPDCQVNDEIDVMVYLDSEDLLIATTETPKVQVGQVACLKVVANSPVGAFLDWGLKKDLLLPFNEQQNPVIEGESVVVYAYIDNSNRICASSKLNRYLDKTPPKYKPRQKVDLVIADRTDLGLKAVVNNSHWGMIFGADIFQPLRYGQCIDGFIKDVRPDGKINLLHQQPGIGALDALSVKILAHLKLNNGVSPLSDKSDAEVISRTFGVSKRKFKMAIGGLYKKQLISIEADGIRLLDKQS